MPSEKGSDARFVPTQWSLILAAKAGTTGAEKAREDLCRKYWYPLYAFLRRKGYSPHDAQDLTQGFFADLLRRDWLTKVGPEKGKFRTFLIACLNNFLRNDWNKQHGPQRWPEGGIVPLESGDAEERYAHEPADEGTPEKVFERRWVATLIDQAKAKLRAELIRDGKLALYEKLEPHLAERASRGIHAEAAAALRMNEGALRVAFHRMRKRFGEILRETVAETVASPDDVDEEIRSLFAAWG